MLFITILLISIILIIIGIILFFLENKNNKTTIGKIYKVTDGYFSFSKTSKKPRRVIVVDERRDGALAVVKLYSKENKNPEHYLAAPILSTNNHKSLTKDTILDRNIKISRRKNKKIKLIKENNLKSLNDKLSFNEMKTMYENLYTIESNKNKMIHWKDRFKTYNKFKK